MIILKVRIWECRRSMLWEVPKCTLSPSIMPIQVPAVVAGADATADDAADDEFEISQAPAIITSAAATTPMIAVNQPITEISHFGVHDAPPPAGKSSPPQHTMMLTTTNLRIFRAPAIGSHSSSSSHFTSNH
jgi:hypothetical protein